MGVAVIFAKHFQQVQVILGVGAGWLRRLKVPHGQRLKTTALLTAALVAMVFVVLADRAPSAAGNPAQGSSTVRLTDPLSFIAERSPGERDDFGLLTTKPQRTAALPEERVLPTERDRDSGAGLAPAADNPVFGEAPGEPESGALPGEGSIPGGEASEAGGEEPFINGPLAGPTPGQPLLVPTGLEPSATFVAAVPEPATWAMLIIGFLGVGAALRRRSKPGPSSSTAEDPAT